MTTTDGKGRLYALVTFMTHGVADASTTILLRYVRGPYAESNPFVRDLLIGNGYIGPWVVIVVLSGIASVLYVAVYEDRMVYNVFGQLFALSGTLVAVWNCIQLATVLI